MTLAAFILSCMGLFGIVAMLAYHGYLPIDTFGRVDATRWKWRGRILEWSDYYGDDGQERHQPLLYRSHDQSKKLTAFYKAENLLQRPLVLLVWHLRMWKAKSEGRLFVVPGRQGCTRADDAYRWMKLHNDMVTVEHLLRVRHNHWRHDMDNDAIAIEFATSADHDEFQRRAATIGPSTFNFRDYLAPDALVQLDTLLTRNRILTDMEKRPWWRRTMDSLDCI